MTVPSSRTLTTNCDTAHGGQGGLIISKRSFESPTSAQAVDAAQAVDKSSRDPLRIRIRNGDYM